MNPGVIALISIGVTVALAGVGYLIKGMFATGELTKTVAQLSTQMEKNAQATETIRATMLTPTHLDNAILKLKLELAKEMLPRRKDDP